MSDENDHAIRADVMNSLLGRLYWQWNRCYEQQPRARFENVPRHHFSEQIWNVEAEMALVEAKTAEDFAIKILTTIIGNPVAITPLEQSLLRDALAQVDIPKGKSGHARFIQ